MINQDFEAFKLLFPYIIFPIFLIISKFINCQNGSNGLFNHFANNFGLDSGAEMKGRVGVEFDQVGFQIGVNQDVAPDQFVLAL